MLRSASAVAAALLFEQVSMTVPKPSHRRIVRLNPAVGVPVENEQIRPTIQQSSNVVFGDPAVLHDKMCASERHSINSFLNVNPLGLFVVARIKLLALEIVPSNVLPVERVVQCGIPGARRVPEPSRNPIAFVGSPMNDVGLALLVIPLIGVTDEL
jgi:hypothetical protein